MKGFLCLFIFMCSLLKYSRAGWPCGLPGFTGHSRDCRTSGKKKQGSCCPGFVCVQSRYSQKHVCTLKYTEQEENMYWSQDTMESSDLNTSDTEQLEEQVQRESKSSMLDSRSSELLDALSLVTGIQQQLGAIEAIVLANQQLIHARESVIHNDDSSATGILSDEEARGILFALLRNSTNSTIPSSQLVATALPVASQVVADLGRSIAVQISSIAESLLKVETAVEHNVSSVSFKSSKVPVSGPIAQPNSDMMIVSVFGGVIAAMVVVGLVWAMSRYWVRSSVPYQPIP